MTRRTFSRQSRFGERLACAVAFGAVVGCGCRGSLVDSARVLDRYFGSTPALSAQTRALLPPRESLVAGEEATALLPADVLTLEDARAIAVRANPDIHASHARLQAALARIAEARSRYLPNVSLTMNSVRTFMTPASRNPLGAGLQPTTLVPADTGTNNLAVTSLLNALRTPLFGLDVNGNTSPFSEHSFVFSASWTIFDGFIREAQVAAAKLLFSASADSLLDVQRLLINAVDAAYFQAQLAQEQIRIARADEVFSQEQFEETQKLQAAGRATAADVDNFRVRDLAAKASVTAAIGLRDSSRVLLAELMGLSGAALPAGLPLPPLDPETEEEMTLPSAEGWIERSLAKRPDLAQLEKLVASEAENVRAVVGTYFPSLNASGSWGFDRGSTYRLTTDDQSAALGVELRWELYTGGRREAQVEAAEALRAEAVANRNRLRLAVESQVRQAVIDLGDVQEQIRLQRENLEVARENRRIIQVGYLAGKETLTRLNEAQRDFVTADADLTLARIRLRRAWSDLRAASGVVLPTPPDRKP